MTRPATISPIQRGSAWALTLRLWQDRAKTEPEALPEGAAARVQIRTRDGALLFDGTVDNGRVTVDIGDVNTPNTPATISVVATAADTRLLAGTNGIVGVEIQPTTNPNDFYELVRLGVLFEPESVYD